MMVKICGITNPEDAMAAVEAGASALGFNFYRKSPRFIEPEEAAHIIENLPAGVWKAGVFVNAPPDTVSRIAARIGLDVVQLHGDAPPGALSHGLRVWRAMGVGPEFDATRLEEFEAEAFLLDTPVSDMYGGTGKTFDWSRVAGIPRKIIVAGGLDENNVREAIRLARPWGVDACSRLESAPGRKDHARMRAFVKAALLENPS